MSETQRAIERPTKPKPQARAVSSRDPHIVISTVDDRKHRRPPRARGRNEHNIVVQDFNAVLMDDKEDGGSTEMDKMKTEITNLKDDLTSANNTIQRLRRREKELSERLAAEIQRQVKQSGKFENLCQGGPRPRNLIERYKCLYSQERLDALDELEEIPELSKIARSDEIKSKILMAIMVGAYRVCKDYTKQIRRGIHKLLGVPKLTGKNDEKDNDVRELESTVSSYLQSTSESYNIEPIVKDVEDQVVKVLPEIPDMLSKRPSITSYICECVRLSWAMCNQIHPMEIEYCAEYFSQVMHTRFHTSDKATPWIKMYLWPILLNYDDKTVLSKGVVIT